MSNFEAEKGRGSDIDTSGGILASTSKPAILRNLK